DPALREVLDDGLFIEGFATRLWIFRPSLLDRLLESIGDERRHGVAHLAALEVDERLPGPGFELRCSEPRILADLDDLGHADIAETWMNSHGFSMAPDTSRAPRPAG